MKRIILSALMGLVTCLAVGAQSPVDTLKVYNVSLSLDSRESVLSQF